MKVLHVNDYRRRGGCEVIVAQTVDLLRARGVEVEVFTSEDVPGHRRNPLSYIDSRSCRRALRDRLRTFRPHVVHLHNFYHELSPGILETMHRERKRRPVRVVMTAHDFHLACPNAGVSYFVRGEMHLADPLALRRWPALLAKRWDHRSGAHSALKLAQHLWNYRVRHRSRALDVVLCPSRFLERVLSDRGLPTARLPYPLPPPPEATAGRGEPLQLIFAGRIEKEKGLGPFLSSLPSDFRGRFIVVGGGTELEACRALGSRRNGASTVDFRGPLPREETLRLIAASHVLVLPSLLYENQPVSLLEALTVGTNILTSDLGGMKEIVEESGVGFTMRPEDASSVARALRCIESEHERGTLNRFDVRRYLEELSERAHVERLLRIYGDGDAAPVTA